MTNIIEFIKMLDMVVPASPPTRPCCTALS